MKGKTLRSKLMKTAAVLMSVGIMVSSAAGCGEAAGQSNAGSSTAADSSSVSTGEAAAGSVEDLVALMQTAKDASDLPDWSGEAFKVRVWNGHGTGDANRNTATNDVVYSELKRIFGVEIDIDNCFDNGGQDLPSKLAVLAATNDWPELGQNVMNQDLVDSGKLYDLTDYLESYTPDMLKVYNAISPKSVEKGYNATGKLYSAGAAVGVDINQPEVAKSAFGQELNVDRYKYIQMPDQRLGVNTEVYVRDDILKLAYPSAKTQDEIESLYVKNGEFTREELYDVPLTSKQEIFDFFAKIDKAIKDNNIEEGGKPVTASYAFSGQDNWPLLAGLLSGIEGLPNINYFTYFSTKDKTVKTMFTEDWFKQDMLAFNKMVREGIMSEASLIENNELFLNKLNNGEYAIAYAWQKPDEATLKAMDKPYRYRKVYFDINQNKEYGLTAQEEKNLARGGISIFKDKVNEEQLKQVLAMLNFMYTEAGQKLVAWGPSSAGLFEEKDGVRTFTDKELEECVVYGAVNKADMKYNLASGMTESGKLPSYPRLETGVYSGGFYNPKYIYDLSKQERTADMASQFFQSGLFDKMEKSKIPFSKTADIWNFTDEIPEIKQFWDVRGTGFEPAMTKVLAAKSDEEFNESYDKMVKFASDNGLNQAGIDKIVELLKEKYPDDWAAMQAGY